MDYLTFKYMMCRVESSTDSDSEISQRWSDTSNMGCTSSTPDRVTFHSRTLPLTDKPAGRHGCYSMFLDPYDGSSEDSDESSINVSAKGSRRPRQTGAYMGDSRSMFHHPASMVTNDTRDDVKEKHHVLDVQMKCGSDSVLRCRGFGGGTSKDSDLHASRSFTPGPVPPVVGCTSLHCSSERPYCPTEKPHCPYQRRPVHKRKLALPGVEVLELENRKKQCLVNMVDEELKEVYSASELLEPQS